MFVPMFHRLVGIYCVTPAAQLITKLMGGTFCFVVGESFFSTTTVTLYNNVAGSVVGTLAGARKIDIKTEEGQSRKYMGADSKSGDWPLSPVRRLVIGRFRIFFREIHKLTNHHAEHQWAVTAVRVPVIMRDWLPLGRRRQREGEAISLCLEKKGVADAVFREQQEETLFVFAAREGGRRGMMALGKGRREEKVAGKLIVVMGGQMGRRRRTMNGRGGGGREKVMRWARRGRRRDLVSCACFNSVPRLTNRRYPS